MKIGEKIIFDGDFKWHSWDILVINISGRLAIH